ncbi:NitT/TauT family transport system substrate-binding protein [Novimethylophilus kurashikiensis]|uniref:NitT/TauT family transport system substrate-binding protein n=1 Tax=Novimethylophilus kurashikiensis TaxID=1825523 RepID=A0A2R5F577_9PROT|nr:ABC transporter substrate-binding protein [Novimethylophilus kurashikiensis]GBG12828.1 NitT/TauT family transport system substrate-binding protein [Novimethylophilus kurashikiensis]
MGDKNKSKRISRRQFLAWSAGCLTLSLLPACARPQKSVRMALHVWPGYEPTTLASSLGWLDPNMVQIVASESATDSIAMLKRGEVDGAGLTLDEVLRSRENGLPLSIILICDISAGADQFLTKPSYRSLADIKGCKLGVEEGALGALMLHEILKSAGIRDEDVHVIPLPIDKHVAAWQQGDIDCVVTYEPAASRILSLGGKRLFDSREIPNLIIDTLAVRTELLDGSHDEALRHLVANHLRGLRYLNTNSDDAAYRLTERFQLPHDEVLAAFRGLILPDLDNNRRLLESSPPVVVQSANQIATALLEAGLLRQSPRMDDLVRAEFLPKEEA